jgi:predicted nucleic acid-binding protein
MIIADANLIMYLFHESPLSARARAVYEKDPDWVVPDLWKPEVLNALLGMMRAGYLTAQAAQDVADKSAEFLDNRTNPVDHRAVLHIAEKAGLTAYDACYVALARDLNAILVTEDRKIQHSSPDISLSMTDFLNRGKSGGLAKEKREGYRIRAKVDSAKRIRER